MRLLRPKEAAKKLGVTTQTLREMEKRGEIEAVRLPSKRRRYRSSDISRFMGEDRDVLNGSRLKSPECWKCLHAHDCIIMIWMKRGILNNYKERQIGDQSNDTPKQEHPRRTSQRREEAHDMREEVENVLNASIRPGLQMNGGDVEIIDINEETGYVKVAIGGTCAYCSYSIMTTLNFVECELKELIPGIMKVETVSEVVI